MKRRMDIFQKWAKEQVRGNLTRENFAGGQRKLRLKVDWLALSLNRFYMFHLFNEKKFESKGGEKKTRKKKKEMKGRRKEERKGKRKK